MKPIGKKIVIAGISLLILGVLLSFVIDNPYSRRLAGDVINQKLANLGPYKLAYTALSIDLLPLGASVYGVTVTDSETGDSLASVSRIQARPSLLSFFLGNAKIDSLRIFELKSDFPWKLNETQASNPNEAIDDQKAVKTLNWPPQFELPFRELELVNSSISYIKTDAEKDRAVIELSASELNAVFRFDQWDDWSLNLECGQTNVKIEGAHLLKDANLKFALLGQKNRVSMESVEINDNRIRLKGDALINMMVQRQGFNPLDQRLFQSELRTIRLTSDLELIEGDISILGDYLKAKNSQGPLQGALQINVELPLDERRAAWDIKGHAKSDNAVLSGFKLLDSEISFLINEEGFYFTDAKVIEGDQDLAEGSGEILFDSQVGIQFDINPTGVSFTKLLSILGTDNLNVIDGKLWGRHLKLSGKGNPLHLRVEGSPMLKEVHSPFSQSHHFISGSDCTLMLALDINADRLAIEKNEAVCSYSHQQLKDAKKPPEPVYSRLVFNGKVFFDEVRGIDLAISSSNLELALFRNITQIPLTGRIQTLTNIKGSYNDITIASEFQGQKISVFSQVFDFFNLNLGYSVKESKLTIQKLALNHADSSKILLQNSYLRTDQKKIPSELSVNLSKLPNSLVSNILKFYGVESEIYLDINRLEANIKGPLLDPQNLELHGFVAIEDLSVGNQKFASVLKTRFSKSSSNYDFESVYARLGLLELQVKGLITFQNPRRRLSMNRWWHYLGIAANDKVKLQLNTINKGQRDWNEPQTQSSMNHLASLPYLKDYLSGQWLGSDVELQAKIEGPISKPNGSFQGAFINTFVYDSPIASTYFEGFLKGGKLELPVLRHSGNSLLGRLNIDFTKENLPYDWFLNLKQFDFRSVMGPSFAKDSRNYAYLTADWTMQGYLIDWWNSEGSLNISNVAISYASDLSSDNNQVKLLSEKPSNIHFSKSGWQFTESKGLELSGDHFKLAFSFGKNNPPELLDINTTGSIDLQILRQIFPAIETARGQVSIDGNISGPIDNIAANFRFRDKKLDPFHQSDWKPVTIGLADLPPAISNIMFDASFSQGRLTVNSFEANKGKQGRIFAEGSLDLFRTTEKPSMLKIKVEQAEFNRFSIPVFNTADVTMSGQFFLSGSEFPFNLRGDITIDQAQSIGNFDVRQKIIQALNRKKYASPGVQRDPFVNLDLRVVSDRSIYIKNRNLESTISANLNIQGNDTDPLILGRVEIDEGEFLYKQVFDIDRGLIIFDDPNNPTNPRLDIIGTANIDNYRVEVMLTGTATDPIVTINVNPSTRPDGTPITKVDALLLITTGQLRSNEQASPLEAASNEALSLVVGFAEGPLEKIIDASGQTYVRQIYIDSYYSEAESKPVTRLNLPININKDLRLVLQVDAEDNSKAIFQYSLHEGISVSGSIDDPSESQKSQRGSNLNVDTGVDLKFRFNFD